MCRLHFLNYLPIIWYHQQRPESDISHSVRVQPGFSGTYQRIVNKLPSKLAQVGIFPTCVWEVYLSIYLPIYLSIYLSICLSVCLSVCLSICGSTALVDFGRFFGFIIVYTVVRTPWTGDQPIARPLPTHRTTQIQNKLTQRSMPWVGFEHTIPMFERAKTVHALDRVATVIGMCLGSTRFKPWAGPLSWLKCFLVFSSPSRQIPER
jgi:hypothetical protein